MTSRTTARRLGLALLLATAEAACGSTSAAERVSSAEPSLSPAPSVDGGSPATNPASGSTTPRAGASSSAQPPAGSAPSRIESRTFDSASLGVKKTYRVLLPKGYDDSQRRFPVVYYLYGLGGNEGN